MSTLDDLTHIPVFVRAADTPAAQGNLQRFDQLEKTGIYDFEVIARDGTSIRCPRYTPGNLLSLFRNVYDTAKVRTIRAVPSLSEVEAREAPFLEAEYHASFARQKTYKEAAD